MLNFSGLESIRDERENELKVKAESNSDSTSSKIETQKNENTNSSIEQFIKNQSMKHLSTKFSHKDIVDFLKEKDKAMQKIKINEDIDTTNEDEEEEEENQNDKQIKNEDNNEDNHKKQVMFLSFVALLEKMKSKK